MTNFEITLFVFLLSAFVIYNGFVWVKYGVQKSISADIYVLTGPFEKSYYSLFILSMSIPMMILSDNTIGWWAGALLALDFAAPAGGDRMQNFLHCFGADVGMGLGILMVGFVFHLWFLAGAFIVFSLIATKWKNGVTWVETAAFVTVYTGLLIHYLR